MRTKLLWTIFFIAMGGCYLESIHKELMSLNNELIKILDNPKKSNEKVLMEKLDNFSRKLYEIRDFISQRNVTALEVGKQLKKRGKLTLLKKKIDDEKLMETFKWEDKEIRLLNLVFEDTKYLWKSMLDVYRLHTENQTTMRPIYS